MANKTIEELPQINHHDVKPMYNSSEILNKLATAVSYLREQKNVDRETLNQALELELMYSICKAVFYK